jgi:hypothetical protein
VVPTNTCLQLDKSSKFAPMICSQHVNIPPNFHDQDLGLGIFRGFYFVEKDYEEI